MDEPQFIQEFLTYYNDAGEYDISIAFDIFYETLISIDRKHELFNIYFPTNDFTNEEELIYDKLYGIVEESFVNDCESQANADIDE